MLSKNHFLLVNKILVQNLFTGMKHLFTLITILFTINCFAQERKNVNTYIKWVPSSLVDPFAESIQFSLEKQLSTKYSINYGLGYITKSDFGSLPSTGYRARVGFRIYRRGLRPTFTNFFHGPTIITRQAFQQNQGTICLTPGCSSTMETRYVQMQTRFALTYGYGWHLVSANHLSLELELLQGIAYRRNRYLGLPPIAMNPDLNSFFSEPNFIFFGNGFRPAFHILLKVGFGFHSKWGSDL